MDKLKQENNYETSWLCNNCTFQFLAATKRQETATPRLPFLNISRREPNSLQDSLLHKSVRGAYSQKDISNKTGCK